MSTTWHLKRFLLFQGQCHYASGGWTDFAGSFDTLADALAHPIHGDRRYGEDWRHVVDMSTGEIVHAEENGVAEDVAGYFGRMSDSELANRKGFNDPPDYGDAP